MLAQNFKPAIELDITEEQRQALIKTLVLLETGKVKHVEEFSAIPPAVPKPMGFTGHFNMRAWSSPSECGTVACIGGTAELIGGKNVSFYGWNERADGLSNLFAPPMHLFNWRNITVEMAARALRSYLTTGGPKWDEAGVR